MTQQEALDVLKTGANVFLTGSAGSGKTYVLNRYIKYLQLQNKNVGITAPTGVAATHIGGITLNAWAGVGIKQTLSDNEIDELLKRNYLRRRLSQTHVLIIDEVSMLSVSLLALVNRILQSFKKNDAAFGGIQVVLCGDFFQLPPIDEETQNDLPTNFIYDSPLWEELDPKVCYLEKPFRQDDERFLHILSQIRQNNITKEIWETLKDRFFQSFVGLTPTRLYTHNSRADIVNIQELAKLDEQEHVYDMTSSGNPILADVMKKNCLAPSHLIVKKHALVMFVKNNFDEGYANGTMGRIIDFTENENYPIVQTFNHKEIVVRPSTWSIEEEGQIGATIKQIPLRLAWAITIHKSQGMSLDAAEIDLGKSFLHGMGYVALSRVRSLKGIRLMSINSTSLKVSEEAIRIDKQLQKQSALLAEELRASPYYKKNQVI
jgi:ATP-dependent exoDNAse (exonuclease V) alpha subunit